MDDKPLITFFGIKSLINSFGSEEAVRSAFESFRNACKAEGLKGVSIALCSHPEEERVTVAQNCGIDILTGYNYHEYGFIPENEITPVDSLTSSSIRIWNKFAKISTLPYIPVATLNWDIRPWKPSDKLRYVGYSSESVYKSIEELQKWVNNNYNNTCKERIAFLYAWNEYGEGAWLTPSPYGKEDFLQGVQRALKNNKKK